MSSNGISSLKQVHLSNEHQKQIFFSHSSSQESLTAGKFTNLHISFDDWLITVDNNKKEKTAKSSFSEVMCQKWKLLLLQMMSQALLKKHVLFIFLSKNSNIHSRLKEGAKREYNYGNQSSLNDWKKENLFTKKKKNQKLIENEKSV